MTTNPLAALTLAAGLALAGSPTAPATAGGGASCALLAGPPAVCVPIACSDEIEIPWSNGAFGKDKAYDPDKAVKDAIATLEKSDCTLTHMETLRRAVVYLVEGRRYNDALLGQLIARAAAAEADDLSARERALAWFDAGYFATCLDQMGVQLGWAPGAAEGVWGYEWLERAGEADMSDPAIRFALALASHPGVRSSKRDLWELHMTAAIKGSGPNSLVRRNIDSHLAHWNEKASDFVG